MATLATSSGVGSAEGLTGALRKAKTPNANPLVLAAAILPYLASLHYGFVHDDDAQVLSMSAIRSWSFVPGYFYKPIPGFIVRYYRPLFFLWFRINSFLWNTHPWGWHLTNVILHAAASLLVMAVLRRYFKDPRCALAGALLFAVHPAHVETVAWVSGCTDALMAVSLLGSLLLWMKNVEAPSSLHRVGSLVCCATALFSKETAVILPILIFFHAFAGIPGAESDARTTRNRLRFAVLESVPYGAMAAAFLAVRHLVLRGMPATPEWISQTQTILTMPSLLLFYASHLIWPMRTSIFYDFPIVSSAASAAFWAPIILFVGVALGFWTWFRRGKDTRILASALWFLLPIIPVLYIRMFRPDEFVHDRYLYLPVIALSILAGMLFESLWKTQPDRKASTLPLALAIVIVVSLAVATVAGAQPWQSNLSLYTYAAQVAPNNTMGRNNLASEYAALGRYQDASDVLGALLKDHPNMWLANYNYGYVNYRMGNFVLADEFLQRAIQIDPKDADQYVYLGTSYFKQGRLEDADAALRQGIARRPDGNGYHLVLGLVLLREGNLSAARAEVATEVSDHPESGAARGELQAIDKQIGSAAR